MQISNPPPAGLANPASVAITGGTIAGITDLAVADGGTGASTAAAARTSLGFTVQTPTTVPAEVIADAKSNPPGGFSVINGGTLTSASQAVGALSLTPNVAGDVDWTAVTQTQESMVKTYSGVTVTGDTRDLRIRVGSDSTLVDNRGIGLICYKSGALATFARLMLLRSAGGTTVYSDIAAGFTNSGAIAGTPWTSRVWLRMLINGGTVTTYYATVASPGDGDWTQVRSDSVFTAGDTILAGPTVYHATDNATAFVAKVVAYDDSDMQNRKGSNNASGFGFATSTGTTDVQTSISGSPARIRVAL